MLHTDRFGRQEGLERVAQAWSAGTGFDALVCFTDLLAFGAIRAFADAGVRIPEDVAIASIDDVQEAEYSVPSLTTIAPDKRAIAAQAVDAVLALLDDDTREPANIEIGYELVVRESSGAGQPVR